jgi:vesicle-fusing ATPase
VLFEGARRTGKTLAAHVLAQALSRELFRIDLAAVVSRYIGETEKNLSALFDEAEASGAVLLIDDADALFGRGGEVKDAHDRYANLDVARLNEQLSERIAAFKGLVIVVSDQTEGSDEDGLFDRWRRRARLVRFPRTQRG